MTDFLVGDEIRYLAAAILTILEEVIDLASLSDQLAFRESRRVFLLFPHVVADEALVCRVDLNVVELISKL